MQCYAKIQGYHYILALDSDFECNNNEDGYFRRHCVVSKILPHFDYVLFVDADIGVVNPQKRIEDYIDPNYDIIFYDRFYNWEVMAGSYLARNTKYAAQFLAGWADFEQRVPRSFHGTDNGALHDLFTFEACIRSIFGSRRKFRKIAILEKGTGWARDNWLTNSLWSKEHDFMLHNWKETEKYPKPRRFVDIHRLHRYKWYNPLLGKINTLRCSPRNSTWNYDEKLIIEAQEVEEKLKNYAAVVAREQALSLTRLKFPDFLSADVDEISFVNLVFAEIDKIDAIELLKNTSSPSRAEQLQFWLHDRIPFGQSRLCETVFTRLSYQSKASPDGPFARRASDNAQTPCKQENPKFRGFELAM
ncbi:unnamed protein product [Caenorhabditis auriculariae]|uniref:Nucleotide-diphospho-sugar transferase domain-containing protein n=1 Tax=Caenorhabditis auriculariae TaxID=2777116 RepID=A0A8S1HS64_9PELO|nr:unnamed protein product [Caenorhabditis auriculariae]